MNLIPGTGMVPPPPPPPPDDDDVCCALKNVREKVPKKKRVMMKERWTGRKNKDKEEISKKKNLSVREMIDLFVLF